jgi:hypothetical protein
MKVCIVTFYDNNIKIYGDITSDINKRYCNKYNIDFKVNKNRTYKIRKPNWEKIPTILDYIVYYDYIIWIDADAIFYNDAENIIDIINKHKNADFIFSNDFDNININTGFFIIKNSNYSIHLLNLWSNNKNIYKYTLNSKYEDQAGLEYIFRNNIMDIKNHCVIYKYGYLQHFNLNKIDKLENTYVLHLAGRGRNKILRANVFKKYLEYLNALELSNQKTLE